MSGIPENVKDVILLVSLSINVFVGVAFGIIMFMIFGMRQEIVGFLDGIGAMLGDFIDSMQQGKAGRDDDPKQ